METNIITVYGKNYKVSPAIGGEYGNCTDCSGRSMTNCNDLTDKHHGHCVDVIFREVTEVVTQVKPTIQMNLELDLSKCILPVFFTVKNLRLQSLDTALKNQSDAYSVSVKDLPQDTLEIVADELKREFIKRNTKVQS